ncbi:hypothetical protein LIPSTDRAFT_201883 [Lipomyces starkeyi NRRL Y-11557]|uniref:C2H2-type domain-containing protein n=1 Tax=Lipomyces starkeyi NRRL Y-11557 TaxID=675824 RepID=A0A1E3PUQ8_LIPST|nr:hypothetical protein LIPSTDRAFT_201883 [Lipomyces starkeyi NRRL Y-11557]
MFRSSTRITRIRTITCETIAIMNSRYYRLIHFPTRFKKPALPALSPGSDYEADYSSEGLSPGFESTEDITDISFPELAQGKTFSSRNPYRKVDWNTVWQPILTADPVTNAQFTINLEDERHSKVPTKTLDSYVEGPGADGKYICRFTDCGKKFGRKCNIRMHIQTHLADKPHLCTVCGSRFVRTTTGG